MSVHADPKEKLEKEMKRKIVRNLAYHNRLFHFGATQYVKIIKLRVE